MHNVRFVLWPTDEWDVLIPRSSLLAKINISTQVSVFKICRPKSSIAKIQAESPHLMDLIVEATNVIFDNPTSIFITTNIREVVYEGMEINCNRKEYSAIVVCKLMKRSGLLHVTDDPNIMKLRWFEIVRLVTFEKKVDLFIAPKRLPRWQIWNFWRNKHVNDVL